MKELLLTGSSGFLGSIILQNLTNFSITTLGRTKADICVDLSKTVPCLETASLVIHAAGKAHTVPRSSKQVQEFYDVNVTGTKNLLIGLEQGSVLPEGFVFISSVAVYGLENGFLIDEQTPLLAKDPYGKSKIQAENLVGQWCAKNKVLCTILRLPLLVGPNPPGNLRAMIKGIKAGYYFNIAGGIAKKSLVLAEDVAKVIPVVAHIGGTYNLTDGYNPSFSEISAFIANQLNKSCPINLPMKLAKVVANVGDCLGSNAPLNTNKLIKITSHLTFDHSKAIAAFSWNPTPVLNGFKI